MTNDPYIAKCIARFAFETALLPLLNLSLMSPISYPPSMAPIPNTTIINDESFNCSYIGLSYSIRQ